MKRISCGFVLMALMFNLAACSENGFCNIVSFTERFNKVNSAFQIEYADYVIDEENTFSLFFPKENPVVLLKLTENEVGEIEQCRILVGKYDSKANQRLIGEKERKVFFDVIKASVMAFTSFSEQETLKLMYEFLLHETNTIKKQGEMNKTQSCFHFVYYSNSLASMFTVTNTWLREIPKTEKPESKPYFGATTNVDGESIKLQQ